MGDALLNLAASLLSAQVAALKQAVDELDAALTSAEKVADADRYVSRKT